jgi:hypothetical protein
MRLNLAAQPRHVHVDAALIGIQFLACDRAAQLLARLHPPGARHQRQKQREFGPGQRDLAPVVGEEPTPVDVQRAACEAQQPVRCRRPLLGGAR